MTNFVKKHPWWTALLILGIFGCIGVAVLGCGGVSMAASASAPRSTRTPRPTVQPAPTNEPAPTSTPEPVANAMDACPTDREMWVVFGFEDLDVKPVFSSAPWEPCKWQWQSNEHSTTTFVLEEDWQATITDRAGNVLVYYGDGEVTLTAQGFTLRYLDNYPVDSFVHDPQVLWEAEWEFGWSRDPQYPTCPGNIDVTAQTDDQATACGLAAP